MAGEIFFAALAASGAAAVLRRAAPVLTALPALLFFCAGAAAQSLPLDDKARYEKSLEQKVEEVLVRLVGPNQAKVLVQATMDFTRTEKIDMTSQAAQKAARDSMFKWDGGSAENRMFSEYLLPGFPSMDSGRGDPETSTYQKQMLFPASLVKRLTVSVILNRNLSEPEVQNVRTVVAESLLLDPRRGDELLIIRSTFAPFWKTIWYSPEALNLLFKYGILTIMGIVSMIVVAVGFLKLAAAMNTMAKAQQSHQITMDLGKGAAGGVGLPGAAGGLERLDLSAGQKKEQPSGGAEEGPQRVVFAVTREQVPFLIHLMAGEDPANVALVSNHLEPAVRADFLRGLDPAMASSVISHMAKVRFVDGEVVNTIKDELERRLSGAVGGVAQVVEVVETLGLAARKRMLEELAAQDPQTAAEVRKQVFIDEDLLRLPERDLSVLISGFRIETLTSALWGLSDGLKARIRAQMAEKTWLMVEQTLKYGAPSREKSEQAVEELVGLAVKLMREGKIRDPRESDPRLIEGGFPPPPPPPPPEPAPAAR